MKYSTKNKTYTIYTISVLFSLIFNWFNNCKYILFQFHLYCLFVLKRVYNLFNYVIINKAFNKNLICIYCLNSFCLQRNTNTVLFCYKYIHEIVKQFGNLAIHLKKTVARLIFVFQSSYTILMIRCKFVIFSCIVEIRSPPS